MGSCAAPSAKGDDKFITTDYLQQCHIRSVPTLVVYCRQGYDVIRGNLRVKQALEKVVTAGDCRQVAAGLLDGAGDKPQ